MRATELRTSELVHPLFYTLPAVALSLATLYSLRTGVPLGDLMRDHSWVTQSPLHVGLISTLGALLWAAGASVCLFSGFLLRSMARREELARLLLCAGALTTMLLLDDLFLFHETLFPHYLGVAEKLTLASYCAATLWLLTRFRTTLLTHEPGRLLIALALFATSLGVDLVQGPIEAIIGDARILLEDGSKFLGIAAWSGYFVALSLRVLRESNARSRA